MSKALELFGEEEAKETAKFAEMFNKFFDCLNVASFTVGKRKRDCFKSPYRSGNDFRLRVSLANSVHHLEYFRVRHFMGILA